MSKSVITELTEEQEIVLRSYIEKWKAIALLTKPIKREKATAVIENAYKASNYSEPEVIFFGSPFAAINKTMESKFETRLGCDISDKFSRRVYEHLLNLIKRQLAQSFFYELLDQILYPQYPNHLNLKNNPLEFNFPMGIEDCVETQIKKDLDRLKTIDLDRVEDFLLGLMRLPGWSIWGCMFDFCISELDLQHDRFQWQVMQELIQHCDFVLMFENVCLICDRPNKLLLDNQNQLHGEWEHALRFPDGYGVYGYHGGQRPEGKRCQNDQYIEPGTRVKLSSTEEYGIVVHCWYSDEIYDYDCYVAFYGSSFPDSQTDCRPYILRYATVSLEIIS